ncbi:type II secretion system protein [Alkalibacter rhizosphaerae]|uniref:Type II secretion system protein n=1 Tax=Alkalibacter rhizosphaerae TaxID=2815577 RepID=A0A975AIG3_9FIRM|nr:type II secretion system protein [Alkalibacter rhizosphaerae]QSX08649.1 type II secretion system protein [Alkalibacter rhizosphaerae]
MIILKVKGFTFIEIIVSIFILCILSISFLFMSTFYLSAMARASSRYEQTNRAEEVLEAVVSDLKEGPASPATYEALEQLHCSEYYEVTIKPYEGKDRTLEVEVWQKENGIGLQTLVHVP